MNMIRYLRVIAASALGLTSLVPPVAAEQLTKIDFSSELVGAEPKALVAVVGNWRIESEGGKNVLAVDGRQWKEGQSSAGVADKARALYGERYAEFLDRVQAYAYYPYAVTKDVEDFRGGEITVRFEGLSGRIDQGAGILFNLKPNGDYLALRANCLENIWFCGNSKKASVHRSPGFEMPLPPLSNGTILKSASLVPRLKAISMASSISNTPYQPRSPAASVSGQRRTATCIFRTTE